MFQTPSPSVATVFADTIAEVTQYVQRGIDVKLYGPQGSGKTSVLAALQTAFTADGWKTVSLTAFATTDRTASLPFAFSNLTDAQNVRELGVVAAFRALVDDAKLAKLVVLIDEAEKLHDLAWGVIVSAQAAQHFTVVASFEKQTRDEIFPENGRSFHQRALAVEVPPISLPNFGLFLEDKFGVPFDPQTVMRILTKSSGNPGTALLIVEASKASGALVQRKHRWVVEGPLWGTSLEGFVASKLEVLSDGQIERLAKLAARGLTSFETAVSIVGASELQALRDLGFVRFHEARGKNWVAIDPPIIAEYFRQTRLRAARTSPQRQSVPSGAPALVKPSNTFNIPEAVHFALMREHQFVREHASREAWETAPSAATAYNYISDLVQDRGSSARIEATFSAAVLLDPGTFQAGALRVLHAKWTAFAQRDIARALEELDLVEGSLPLNLVASTARRYINTRIGIIEHLDDADLQEAFSLLPEEPSQADWCEPDASPRSHEPEVSGGLLLYPADLYVEYLTASIEACVFTGQLKKAQTLLALVPESHVESIQVLVMKGLLCLAMGKTHEAQTILTNAFDRSCDELSPAQIRASGWALAFALYLQGKYRAVVSISELVYGACSVPWFPTNDYFVLRGLQTISYLRLGEMDKASEACNRRTQDKHKYGRKEVGILDEYIGYFESLAHKNLDDAGASLWNDGQRLMRRGNVLFGILFMATSLSRDPDPTKLAELQIAASNTEIVLVQTFVEVLVARESSDLTVLAEAVRSALDLEQAPVTFAAYAAYIEGLKKAGHNDRLDTVEAELRDFLQRSLNQEVDVEGLDFPKEKLTMREREIAILLVQGMGNQAIAKAISLSPGTVNNYVHKLMRKTNSHSREQLLRRVGHLIG